MKKFLIYYISLKKEITATKEKGNNDAVKLKAQSIKRFNELKEQIIRTAEEIEKIIKKIK